MRRALAAAPVSIDALEFALDPWVQISGRKLVQRRCDDERERRIGFPSFVQAGVDIRLYSPTGAGCVARDGSKRSSHSSSSEIRGAP